MLICLLLLYILFGMFVGVVALVVVILVVVICLVWILVLMLVCLLCSVLWWLNYVWGWYKTQVLVYLFLVELCSGWFELCWLCYLFGFVWVLVVIWFIYLQVWTLWLLMLRCSFVVLITADLNGCLRSKQWVVTWVGFLFVLCGWFSLFGFCWGCLGGLLICWNVYTTDGLLCLFWVWCLFGFNCLCLFCSVFVWIHCLLVVVLRFVWLLFCWNK